MRGRRVAEVALGQSNCRAATDVARSLRSRLRDHLGWMFALALVVTVSVAIAAFRMGQRSSRRATRSTPHGAGQTVVAPSNIDQSNTTAPVPTPAVVPSSPVVTTSHPAERVALLDAGLVAGKVTARDSGPADSGGTISSDAAVTSAETASDAGVVEKVEPPPQAPVSCGSTWCGAGLVCCNASCGLCAPPGVLCSQRMCGVVSGPISVLCGMSTCNVGYVCCNASCGTCTLPGETCDSKPCGREMQFPTAEPCGFSTCNTGFECCNPSCGTCVRPGEPCSHKPCGW